MRLLVAVLLVTVGACKDPGEVLAEKAVEVASGGKVKVDGQTVTIKDEEGNEVTTTVTEEDGAVKGVVKNADGTESTYQADESGVTVKSKDGTATFGSTEVPADFPLPVLDGAEVAATASTGKPDGGKSFHVSLKSARPPAEIADFYQAALRDSGMKVRRQEHKMAGTHMVMLSGSKGKKKQRTQASVHVSKPPNEEKANVMITWSGE
jgi:hypothetical protein